MAASALEIDIPFVGFDVVAYDGGRAFVIMLMVWDSLKRQSNIETHGLDFADAGERFEWATATFLPAHPAEDGRPRFRVIGYLDGTLVGLVFSLLGAEAISAISLRPASRKERKLHAEEKTRAARDQR